MIDYCLSCLDNIKKEASYRNIFRHFCSHGNRPAVQYTLNKEIKVLTYADMEFTCEYAGDKIKALIGDAEKGFVCLKLANCPEWYSIFWGILIAGYKPFLIDARHDKNLTQYFIDQAKAVAIICNEANEYENTKKIEATDIFTLDRKHILEVSEKADRASKTVEERITSYEWGDEVALCTSGTTSTAKIYIYDGEAMTNQIMCAKGVITVNEVICSDSPKRNLAFLPLNHIFGFMANYIWYSVFAASQVVPEKIAPSVLLSTCRDHKVTHMLAVPLLVNNIASGLMKKLSKESKLKQFGFNAMLNIGLFCQHINPLFGIKVSKKLMKNSVLSQLAGDSIECIICGGGHVLPETMKIVNGIGYFTLCGFGMTEVGISSMEKRLSLKKRLAGCVGVPIDDIEYRIVPLNDNDPSVGELQMRGNSMHSAMIKDGVRTGTDLNEEGWFATGDIGRLVDGALYIEGRLKEVIINESGENVYPDELEDTFLNIDGVKNFTVLGIKKAPDSKYEDIVLVCQVSEEINDEYIEKIKPVITARNKTLMGLKKVDYALLTTDDLPLSNGIKVRRVIIKREVENGEGNYVKLDKIK